MSKTLPIIITTLITALFVSIVICGFGFWALSYFTDSALEKSQAIDKEIVEKTERDKAFEQCRELGGIPISAFWDGRLKDCQFPNQNK